MYVCNPEFQNHIGMHTNPKSSAALYICVLYPEFQNHTGIHTNPSCCYVLRNQYCINRVGCLELQIRCINLIMKMLIKFHHNIYLYAFEN